MGLVKEAKKYNDTYTNTYTKRNETKRQLCSSMSQLCHKYDTTVHNCEKVTLDNRRY